MLKLRITKWIAAGLIGSVALPATAWGPDTQRTVVSSAGHVFSRNSSIPLTNLIDYVNMGANISRAEDDVLFSGFEIDPVRTMQREIFLLQGIKSSRVDPYFAFRLGALGKKITEFMAPMQGEDPAIRDTYYADVEAAINGVRLQSERRDIVEPQLYFARVYREAQANNSAIAVDYRSGLGFKGIGGKTLSSDASRAVDVVADVWYTIFRSQVDSIDISKSDMREYMLASIDFYLRNKNIAEVNDVYARAKTKNILTLEMKNTIGDLYYDNGFYPEALMVYGELLAEDPGLREVSKRIAEYHVSVGEEKLRDENLESAREAFLLAVESDGLHPEAQRNLVLTTRSIEKRDERYAQALAYIELAQRAEMDAEESGVRRDYAESIQYLRESEQNYSLVTDEFADPRRQANIGLKSVQSRLNEMKKALVENAQLLSGSGFTVDARKLVSGVGDTSNDAMTSALKADYKSALEQLTAEMNQP